HSVPTHDLTTLSSGWDFQSERSPPKIFAVGLVGHIGPGYLSRFSIGDWDMRPILRHSVLLNLRRTRAMQGRGKIKYQK
ncbi:MAG: hypothetical protein ACYS4T_16515, partial [Planctomycetota bacterium]